MGLRGSLPCAPWKLPSNGFYGSARLQTASRIGLLLQARSRTDGHTAIPCTKFYVDILKLETVLHNANVVFLVPADSQHRGKALLKGVICWDHVASMMDERNMNTKHWGEGGGILRHQRKIFFGATLYTKHFTQTSLGSNPGFREKILESNLKFN